MSGCKVANARAPDLREQARPYTLIAELTHRCPLRCAYCSNPLALASSADELSAGVWTRVFHEAAELGVLQLHLSGGEPLLRRDLEQVVAGARASGLYVNLVTSAVGLTRERLTDLRDAGVDHVQVSLQGLAPAVSKRIAGVDALDQKLLAMTWVKELELPLTMNVVLHRDNIGQLEGLIDLARRMRADRLELANVQYLGWALLNRRALLPTEGQIAAAHAVTEHARAQLRGSLELVFVMPDYYARFPRSCMDGWGRRFMVVAPDGRVMPCHAASSLPNLTFERVTEAPLASIWHGSTAFQAFRGEAWMKEPCRSCDRRTRDFGGCRCQAFALTGDSSATDPSCCHSPDRSLVTLARHQAEEPELPRLYLRGSR